jgi:hypothetical protein
MLRDILLALVDSSSISPVVLTSENVSVNFEGEGPFSRLKDKLLFSRQLILTYNLLLVAVVVLLSLRYWGKRATRWFKARGSGLRHTRHNNTYNDYDDDAETIKPLLYVIFLSIYAARHLLEHYQNMTAHKAHADKA